MFGIWRLIRNLVQFLRGNASVEVNDDPNTVWCLVGNIVREHRHGPGGTVCRGSKHFTAGTKVYRLPSQWGDGYERVVAIGLHRGSKKWATVVMPSTQITNWRVQVVYKPAVLNRLRDGFRKHRTSGHSFNHQWTSRAASEGMADYLRKSSGNTKA